MCQQIRMIFNFSRLFLSQCAHFWGLLCLCRSHTHTCCVWFDSGPAKLKNYIFHSGSRFFFYVSLGCVCVCVRSFISVGRFPLTHNFLGISQLDGKASMASPSLCHLSGQRQKCFHRSISLAHKRNKIHSCTTSAKQTKNRHTEFILTLHFHDLFLSIFLFLLLLLFFPFFLGRRQLGDDSRWLHNWSWAREFKTKNNVAINRINEFCVFTSSAVAVVSKFKVQLIAAMTADLMRLW